MLDSILNFLSPLIPDAIHFLSGLPIIGKILAPVMIISAGASGIVSSFIALWHALVLFLKALSMIPGLGKLSDISDMLLADEKSIDDWSKSKLLPILNRFSVIAPPSG